MVTRLDRLARSTRDLLNVLHEVAQSGAAFKSLHDAWADTTTPHGRLMLTILGGLAEFERSLIKARTDVGIKRAREAGIKFGRPSKLTKHQREEALKLLDQGEPQSAVARLLNVDQSTISRLASRLAASPREGPRLLVALQDTLTTRYRTASPVCATTPWRCVSPRRPLT
jgi:DNA invertase Pin-like site-specific DNA recombinase